MIVIGSVFLFLAVGMRHELKRLKRKADMDLASAPENWLHRWLWNIWQRYVTKRQMRSIEDFTDWTIMEEDGTQTDSSGDSSDEHMDVVKNE